MEKIFTTAIGEETTLSAEVTITFLLEDVCYLSDLDEDDIENHFWEMVEDRVFSGDYILDFESDEATSFIKNIKMVS